MKERAVLKIREFNRFYLPIFNLLGNRYLNSRYTAAEARVLYEVYENPGCTAADVAKSMNLDKSYLCRVISGHEKNGYLKKFVSEVDLRAYNLFLTEEGEAITEDFIQKSNQQIGRIISELDDADCELIIGAIKTITDVLEKCSKTRRAD